MISEYHIIGCKENKNAEFIPGNFKEVTWLFELSVRIATEGLPNLSDKSTNKAICAYMVSLCFDNFYYSSLVVNCGIFLDQVR